MKKVLIKNLEELADFSNKILNNIFNDLKLAEDSGLKNKATIIATYGNLGSGKTAFTKTLAKNLGITESLTSPTFVILKQYEIDHGNESNAQYKNDTQYKNDNFDNLIHIDAYRLNSAKELEGLSWREFLDNPKNLIIIEWADIVEEILPKNDGAENHTEAGAPIYRLYFEFIDENTRQISTDLEI